jgi:hypothetical protein
MPLSFASGPNKAFAFAIGKKVPISVKFPADSVIPYYGDRTDSSLFDWVNYTPAQGRYIWGTTTQNQVGVSYPAIAGGFSASGTTASAGAHYGNSTTQNWISSTGSPFVAQSGGAPTHSHTWSGSAYSTQDNMLNVQNINLLRSVRPTTHLPVNALIIKQTGIENSVAFQAAGHNYLRGADNVISYSKGTPYNFSVALSVSYDSGHYHASSSSAYRTMASGAYFRNYNMSSAGAHTHQASASFTQSQIDSKLVNLWRLTERTYPLVDLIVMYVGTIANLPSSWKLCDGTNGTINLGGYIIGYSNNQWNITTATDANLALSATDTPYIPHSHAAGYARTANVSGPGAYHLNFAWTHAHSLLGSSSYNSYYPPRIGVAFIQYKG